MNIGDFKRAAADAGIDLASFAPELVLGRTPNDWVVYVAASNAWAFELPISLEHGKVVEVADAIVRWDVAMAEHLSIPREVGATVRWAAALMKPCVLKEVIDSAYGTA
ncbi:hypothetical protein [Herbaspirillum sp. RV1423]|uniref:hypothetical protein n=1 Tax=Herbaspirillum sp. RV1423 TaxID=1443993 RepID=UPI0004AE2E6B|nr:hypothetical protein [Herbaspirillum sp. RV1423]